jgi:hypothetical protein
MSVAWKYLLIYPQTRYLICVTIGPAFLSASIYLCLSRIVHIYSASASRIRPKYYTYVFISCDLLSLTLQGAGGGIAATAGPGDLTQVNLGTNIMITGLSFQVFSLLLFVVLCADFALRIKKVPEPQRSEEYQVLRRTRLFKGFLLSMLINFGRFHTNLVADFVFPKQVSVLPPSLSSFDAAIEWQSSGPVSAEH